jgi:hypothetical protein
MVTERAASGRDGAAEIGRRAVGTAFFGGIACRELDRDLPGADAVRDLPAMAAGDEEAFRRKGRVGSSVLATEAAYSCADGGVMRAIFSLSGPTGSVRLTFRGLGRSVCPCQRLSLPMADDAADGNMEFRIKGKAARLTCAGAATECKNR